jgi:hypothetical protein
MAESLSLSRRDSVVGLISSATARMVALVPAGLALILYGITCSPTVNFTDSGELITVAWTGGIAHPPGYPLYTILSSLFVHLPLSNPAWRMNLLSALFAALAVGLFYLLIIETLTGMPAVRRTAAPRGTAAASRPHPPGRSPRPAAPAARKDKALARSAPAPQDRATPVPPPPERASSLATAISAAPPLPWTTVAGGLAGAGLLAASLTFWNWATQAKFYTLHYAFVAALLWLALRTHRALAADRAANAPPVPRWPPHRWSPSVRLLHLLAFLTGLSLTNHYLTFLLLPGIGLLLLLPLPTTQQAVRRIVRHAGTLLLAGFSPLLLYLYLPIRASMHPLLAWGLPTTWGDFWRQVTAQTYQGLFGTASLGQHLSEAVIYAANQFSPGLGVLLLIPVGAGLIYLWRTDRTLLVASALTALAALVVALNYNIREIATYYVPFYLILLWWAGLGVAEGIRWIASRQAVGATVLRTPALAVIAGALLPLLALGINWGAAGHGNNFTAELYVRNAFQNFRPNAVVLTDYWDFTSASFYFQHVLNERPDVVVIDKSLLRQPFYLDYLERTYPEVVGQNATAFATFKTLLRQWIDTGQTPRQLSAAYIEVLNGFIDSNLGQRPVYTIFIVPASDPQEQREVDALLGPRQSRLVPAGLGYRIGVNAEDRATQDPQFDLRGITSDKVPLDEIEASVVALYPIFLQRIGTYLQESPTPADQQVGTRLLTQATALQPLLVYQDERPRLR